MTPTQVIAIDGPAASGKSSVSRQVAAQLLRRPLSDCYLDTGAMYRCVAWAALRDGIDPENADAVADLAQSLDIQITYEAAGAPAQSDQPAPSQAAQSVSVDGTQVDDQIRTPEVDKVSSQVAAHPQVRQAMVARQREWIAAHSPAVVDGRDIASVVVPDAVLKIYLTATPEVRTLRRLNQLASQQELLTDDATADQLERRDTADRFRTESPLIRAEGAIEIDTSDLTLDEVVARIAELYEASTP